MDRTRRIRFPLRRSSTAEQVGLNLNPAPPEDPMVCCFTEYPTVYAVAEDSAAARAGVRPRDRICKIGSEPVLHRGHDIHGIVAVIRSLPASFGLEVLRGSGPIEDGGLGSVAWEE